jgi:hypothetical protein
MYSGNKIHRYSHTTKFSPAEALGRRAERNGLRRMAQGTGRLMNRLALIYLKKIRSIAFFPFLIFSTEKGKTIQLSATLRLE